MNNNFLVKALKARRKFVSPNSNNNNNNNKKLKNKPGKLFTLSNVKSKTNKQANEQANTQHLFGLMGQEFLKMAANNSFAKNHTIEEQEKTINILLIKLKLAKGLLRKLKNTKKIVMNSKKMVQPRKSQRIKKSTRKNIFTYY